MGIMRKMAKTVDEQNKSDPNYKKMSDDFEKSIAFLQLVILFLKEGSTIRIYGTLITSKKIRKKASI